MSNLHNPSNPRHTRLFELLRQTQVATSTAVRVKAYNIQKVNHDELEAIKRISVESMM